MQWDIHILSWWEKNTTIVINSVLAYLRLGITSGIEREQASLMHPYPFFLSFAELKEDVKFFVLNVIFVFNVLYKKLRSPTNAVSPQSQIIERCYPCGLRVFIQDTVGLILNNYSTNQLID